MAEISTHSITYGLDGKGKLITAVLLYVNGYDNRAAFVTQSAVHGDRWGMDLGKMFVEKACDEAWIKKWAELAWRQESVMRLRVRYMRERGFAKRASSTTLL